MINKKTKRLLSTLLVFLVAGITEMPVLADDNVQATTSYTAASSLVGSNNSVEQNGVKITLSSVVGAKHKLQAIVTIQSQTPFDTSVGKTSDILLTYGENKYNGQSMSFRYPDDKTLVVTIERRYDQSELPEKGPLRLDVVMQKNKVNVGFDVNVDFSESLKNSLEKDFSTKIPQFNSTLNKLESDILGTRLTFTEPEITSSIRDNYLRNEHSYILKVGDKMYSLHHSDSHSYGSDENNMSMVTNYEAKAATYEKIKDQTAMSLIPVSLNINLEDKEASYKENNNDANLETTSNVSYDKNFDFSDGTKGEIYNIERNDNSIKVHLKGATDKEGLMMASTVSMYYNVDAAEKVNDYYDGNRSTTFYKDPNDSLGYIVEFSNVKKDINVKLNCEAASLANKFTIGDEIQL